jgi:outer membrane lipoprotein LolB
VSAARRLALGAAVAALGLLPACASLTPPHAGGSQVLSGRLSVRVDSDPVRALSATFQLSGDARAGALVLSSSLGTTLAQARWVPGEAVLETPGARALYPDLDALAEQTLGERVPLAALFDWLRGRPWTGAASQGLPAGEPGFAQMGWRVGLSRFAEGWVDAKREASPAVTLRARLDTTDASAP